MQLCYAQITLRSETFFDSTRVTSRTRFILAALNIYLYIPAASVVGLNFSAYRTKRYLMALLYFDIHPCCVIYQGATFYSNFSDVSQHVLWKTV